MRFYLHGTVSPEAVAALTRHGHAAHPAKELAEADAGPPTEPRELLAALTKKQWVLLTADAQLVHAIYDQRLAFPGGLIVLLLDNAVSQAAAVDRLFARYPRLTPKRLYTVTPSRVKIRQLPGTA